MSNPRGNLQCNINKIDCHDSATFDKVAESCHDGIVFPSLAEGARGWVFLNFTADIIGKDSTSVIASKTQDLRGNLYPQSAKHAFDKPNKIDCHDSATFDKVAESRNDGNANSFNDKIVNFASAKSTHPTQRVARR
ncbi:hypothetical protein [Helicobacter sp. T3_23-1056]